ncbi:Bacterial regulatory helix-turn-helix protein, lysR family [compost metagenome]
MRCGTVTGAAAMLNISQPALSQILLHAEDQLGFKLFNRVRGRLVPTQEAEELYSQAEHIFGEGGGQRYAQEKGIDYLGALPLAMQIRQQADSGKPTVVADPDSEAAGIYRSVARQVAIKIASKAKDFSAKFPTITVSKNT